MKINLKYIYLLPLIFLFLPAFYVKCGTYTPFYFILILVFSGFLFFHSPERITKLLFLLLKKTPFKYFILFLVWILFSLFILFVFQKISFLHFLYSIIIYCFIYLFLYFIYPAFCVRYLFSIKEIYKFIIVSWVIVFIWGIIAYLGVCFQIDFINLIQNSLSNRQMLVGNNAFIFLQRARSTFFEPGFYAYFICINLPLFYEFLKLKNRLFSNIRLNTIIKKTLIPLAWLNIVLTFSPIALIFGIIITMVYFYKKVLKLFTVRNLFYLLIIILLFIIFGNSILQSTLIKRIIAFLACIKNVELLNFYEPSLYTRIVSYVNSFIVALKHPILGVGLGESKFMMHYQFINSPIVLSKENMSILQQSFYSGRMIFNRNIFCDIVSETGFVGGFIFYFYLFKSFIVLRKITKKTFGLRRNFLLAIQKVLLTIIFLSFYEVSIVNASYHLFIMALSNVILLKNKRGLLYEK